MSESIEVLVAGAGPTGLLLACILAEQGCSIRIVDKLTEPQKISKASGIMPRTLEVLQGLKISDRFVEAGNKIRDLSLYGTRGKLLSVSFEQLDTPFQFLLGLEQYRTEELLTQRLHDLGVEVERGRELVSFEQDDNRVWAQVASGAGGAETVESQFLVGCDGAHSTVRHTLRLPFEGAEDPEHYVVGYLSIDWELPSSEMFELSSSRGTLFGIPLPKGLWAVAGEYDQKQWKRAADGEPDLEELQRLFDERSPVPARLSNPQWLRYFRINHRQAPQYQVGRVFLAGDAAHIHSPVGGQGMNTGLQDAANLGWKLAYVASGRSDRSLLASYHPERHPIGRSIVQVTSFLQEELNLRAKLAMAFRDEMSQIVGHSTRIKNLASRQLGEIAYHYRRSPLVAEWEGGARLAFEHARTEAIADCPGFSSGPHAGDRALDGTIVTPRAGSAPRLEQLYELFDYRLHTLLVFEGTHRHPGTSGTADRLVTEARRVGTLFPDSIRPVVVKLDEESDAGEGVFIVHDAEAHLHHRYGARAECLYLVRPDGYVGYRCEPADFERLSAYLYDRGYTAAKRSAGSTS